MTLQQRYDPHPITYLSICTDGFPNWFSALGPNSAISSGSLLIIVEREVEYAAAVLFKMQRERLKSIEVKKEAVEDFDQYLEVGSPIHFSPYPRMLTYNIQAYFPGVGIGVGTSTSD